MAVKKGYKQTEVGLIPEEWNVVPITSLLEKGTTITYGVVQPGSNDPNGVLFVRGGDIYDGKIQTSQLRKIPRSVARQFARTQLVGGEIVVSLVGYPGETAMVPSWLAGANIARQVALIKLISNQQLSTEYVCKYFQSPLGRKILLNESIGSAQQVINLRDIKKVRVVIPPSLTEQEAIAGALSDADAWIESLEQLIAKKRQIKQGAMQELLTGKRRLPGFSGKWDEAKLIDIAEGRKELFDDGDWIESEHITNQGIRLVQTGNIGIGCFMEKDDKKYIYESSFMSLGCKEIKSGDLLVCRLAEPAGRACVLPDIGETKVVTSVDVTIFRPPPQKANRVFLANVFSTSEWFREVSERTGGTTHKRIARGALGRITIRLPKVDEQLSIANCLADMDTEIKSLEEKLAKAREIKQGMMQELLTGRIRLIEN